MNNAGKIVITGMGIISSLGAGKAATLDALKEERRGIGPIRFLKTKHSELPVGEVPYSDDELKSMISFSDDEIITRTSLLGRVALREAIVEAQLDGTVCKRIAFLNGNTVGGMEKSEQYYLDFQNNNTRNAYIAMHDCGACTDLIAQEFEGSFHLVSTLSTACSSAANAVILGANLIRSGIVDVAVVGGTECLSAFHLNGFNTLMILDHEPCKPFDAQRRGLNLGEGAAYLVMETASCASERQVDPICTLSGYGNACDAFHQTATSPNGEGAYLAMRGALERSGLQPSDIDYINAHGTGTGNNDECEGIAMMRIFGNHVPPVSSTKSYTGHTTSAAGGVESVISILALQHNLIPANLGFKNSIGEHNFQPVPHVVKNVKLRHVLNNSFGFGGNDSSCIFSALDAPCATRQSLSNNDHIYIRSVSHISTQKPLGDEWFDHPFFLNNAFNESMEPDYKTYFAPMVARRMGKLQKRATVTAIDAIRKGGIEMPDAIITGTGLGCIDNTEKFLTAMIADNESCLQPTFFMQSTHNTIGSQIALHLKCHGYNCTYSHRGTSFDSSLMDALTQMRLGEIHNALVGGQDEMTPAYFNMLEKIGFWKDVVCTDILKMAEGNGSSSGSCSLNMLISNQWQENALCRIDSMRMFYQPSQHQISEEVCTMLSENGLTIADLDTLVLGLNGDCDNDAVYRAFAQQLFPDKNILWFKHIFGESFCASSFGVYAGALALKRGIIPAHLLYNRTSAFDHPEHLLVYNHFQNRDHTLILLSKC